MGDYKWETESSKITTSQAKHNEAEGYREKMDAAYGERDLIMANIVNIVRASRDVLVGINRENMKRLGDWGFSVESTPAAKPKAVSAK